MNPFRVSYYAHHVGSGHLRHAQRIAACRLFDLQVTSTGPRNEAILKESLEYVALSPDVTDDVGTALPANETFLHFAPTNSLIQQRFSQLNRAWRNFTPDVVMVDVSVEVALFARLSGYPVAFRRMPGDREDRGHQMAYSLADALFAYFPIELEDPSHLKKYGHKSHYLTAGEPTGNTPFAEAKRTKGSLRRRVVVQTSLASSIPLRHLARAAVESPEWDWDVVGSVSVDSTPLPRNLVLHGVLPDPAPVMVTADVIISSAGHNAVVAAANSHRPVLLIPEDRPFNEQHAFANALRSSANVDVIDTWHPHLPWPKILSGVAKRDPKTLSKALFVPHKDFQKNLYDLIATCVSGPAR